MIKREMKATVMEIFAKENIVRQCQISGITYKVDLCFVTYKLVIEINEDGHAYYENDEIRQKLIENLGSTFIIISSDPDPNARFDPDAEIEKMYNQINELLLKLAVKSAEKFLKQKFAKELLSYMSSISKPLSYIKYLIKKILRTL